MRKFLSDILVKASLGVEQNAYVLGTVGIGTTSPAEKLHVVGKGIFESNVRIYPVSESWAEGLSFIMPTTANWGGLRWQRQRGNNDGNWYIGFTALDSTDDLVFGANNGGSQVNNIIRLTKAGNVGIGTATPYQLFTVNKSNSAGAGGYIRLENTVGGVGANVGIDFATYSPEYYGVSGPTAQIKATDITNYAGRLDINVKETGPSGALQTLASFNYTGNVGIGTTSPAYKLEVNGTGYFNNTLTVNGNIQTLGSANQYIKATGFISNQIGQLSDFGVFDAGFYVLSGGGLQFVGASANRVTMLSNGNVGIGTTSPGYKLEVVGSIWSIDYFIQNSVGTGGTFRLDAYQDYLYIYGDSSAIAGYRFGSDIVGTVMQIGTNGNVGIGTTSPSYKLDVVGEARFGSNYKAIVGDDGTYGGYSTIGFGGTTNGYNRVFGHVGTSDGLYLTAATGRGIDFWTNGSATSRMFIEPGGNVGIGTTSPDSALEINGRVSIRGANELYFGQSTSSIGTWSTRMYASGSTHKFNAQNFEFNNEGYGGNLFSIINSDGVYSNNSFYFPSSAFNPSAAARSTTPSMSIKMWNNYFNGTGLGSDYGTVLEYYSLVGHVDTQVYFDASGASWYRTASYASNFGAWQKYITSLDISGTTNYISKFTGSNTLGNSQIYDNGTNVGIGTTSPGGKLDVVIAGGNVTTYDYGLDVKVSTGGGWARSYRLYNSNYTAGTTFWGTVGGGSSVTYSYWTIGDPASIDITGYNTSYGIFLRPSGNVGIGTTDPGSYKLYVNGGQWGTLLRGGDLGTGSDVVRMIRADNAVAMLVRGDGNVGIGTSSPASLLHINGSGNTFTRYTNTSNSGHYIDIGANGAGESFVYGYGAYPLLFATNGSERMRITTGGSLLIGSTTQAYNPQTQGYLFGVKSNTTQTFISIAKSDQTLDSGGMIMGLDSTTGYVWMRESTNLTFGTNNTARVTIAGGGNVGIGTGSPSLESAGLGLDILNSSYTQLRVRSSASSAGIEMTPGSGKRWEIQANTSSKWFVYDRTDQLYRLLIDTDGNVGIGTISPAAKLQVIGSSSNILHLHKSTGGGDGMIIMSTDFGSGNTYAISPFINGISNGGFEIKDITNNVSRIVIAPSTGNVGIGTTSPNAKLQIIGPSLTINDENTYGLWVSETGDDTKAIILGYDQGIDAGIITAVDKAVTWKNIVLQPTGGNVGIGTISPNAKLASSRDVTSNDFNNLGAVQLKLIGSTYTNKQLLLGFETDNDYGLIQTLNDGVSWSSYNLAIQPKGGNVGIGTTSPQGKLDITGTNGSDLFYLDAQINTDFAFKILSGSNDALILRRQHSTQGDLSIASFTYNGNVGIGTTSPGYKLEVNGPAAFGATTRTEIGDAGTTPTISYGMFHNSGVGLGIASLAGGSTQGIQFWSHNGTSFFQSLRIAGSTGNVGIGTTAPGYKLEVNGGATGNNIARFTTGGGGGGTRGLTVYSDNSQVKLQVTDNAGSQGTWAFLNLNPDGGNVGIGISNPTAKLHVQGDFETGYAIKMTGTYGTGREFGWKTNGGNSDVISLYNVTSGNRMAFFGDNEVGLQTSGSIRFYITSTGNVGIGTTSPSYQFDITTANYKSFRIQSSDDALITIGSTVASSQFYSIGASGLGSGQGSNLFWIGRSTNNPSGLLTKDFVINSSGNVGIGTTSPGYKLSVVANGNSWNVNPHANGVDLYSTGNIAPHYQTSFDWYTGIPGAGTFKMRLSSGGSLSLGDSVIPSETAWYGTAVFGKNGTDKIIAGYLTSNTNGAVIGAHNSALTAWADLNIAGTAIIFRNNSQSETVRITNAGNVGIGTTTPGAKLDITSTNGDQLRISYNSSYYWEIAREASDGRLSFTDSQNGEKVTILPSGNVGIGTTSPTALLQVNGAGGDGQPTLRLTSASSSTFNWASSTEYPNLTAGQTSIHLIGKANSQYNQAYFGYRHVSNGSSSNMVTIGMYAADYLVNILGNGNVGIGTTSPSEKLEVNGSIRLSDGNADGPQLKLASSGYSDWNIDNYSGSLRAYYGGTEYTRLTSSGNFGIGTSSPSYKLHVEGNVSGISIYASHDIAAFSDITVKKDVERIENAIEKVKELNGYTYVRTDDETGTRRAGVIAQEVQKVLPEVVSANPDGTLNVAYANMVALLIEAVKEQQKEIDELKRMLNK